MTACARKVQPTRQSPLSETGLWLRAFTLDPITKGGGHIMAAATFTALAWGRADHHREGARENDVRPKYETHDDLAHEAEIAETLARRWRCDAMKQPTSYRLDYALIRGGAVVAQMEIKDRPRYSWGDLDRLGGYRLSLHKWDAAIRFARDMGLAFVLAVRASGDLRWMCLKPDQAWHHDGIVWAGRRDRGDWQDMEPCATFDVSRFSGSEKKSPHPAGNSAGTTFETRMHDDTESGVPAQAEDHQ